MPAATAASQGRDARRSSSSRHCQAEDPPSRRLEVWSQRHPDTAALSANLSNRPAFPMPWSVAECVLGEPVALADALDSGPVAVVYRTDEGKRVTARLR